MHYTLRIVCSCLSPEAFKLKTHLYFHRVLICSIKFQGIITESAVLLSSVKLFSVFLVFGFSSTWFQTAAGKCLQWKGSYNPTVHYLPRCPNLDSLEKLRKAAACFSLSEVRMLIGCALAKPASKSIFLKPHMKKVSTILVPVHDWHKCSKRKSFLFFFLLTYKGWHLLLLTSFTTALFIRDEGLVIEHWMHRSCLGIICWLL